MQVLLVDKIHFFQFFSVSDKARLDQLKIITSVRSPSLSESACSKTSTGGAQNGETRNAGAPNPEQ